MRRNASDEIGMHQAAGLERRTVRFKSIAMVAVLTLARGKRDPRMPEREQVLNRLPARGRLVGVNERQRRVLVVIAKHHQRQLLGRHALDKVTLRRR